MQTNSGQSKNADRLQKAIFLDRDGTINREVDHLRGPEEFELLPGAAEAIAGWNAHDWIVILVTNQAGIGRGLFPADTVDAVHKKMARDLAVCGAHVDGIFICPHHPDEGCDCRKPKTLMFEQAAREFHIDFSRSYLIGDKLADLLPARKLGARAILVRTGYGSEEEAEARNSQEPEIAVVSDLKDAYHYVEHNG